MAKFPAQIISPFLFFPEQLIPILIAMRLMVVPATFFAGFTIPDPENVLEGGMSADAMHGKLSGHIRPPSWRAFAQGVSFGLRKSTGLNKTPDFAPANRSRRCNPGQWGDRRLCNVVYPWTFPP